MIALKRIKIAAMIIIMMIFSNIRFILATSYLYFIDTLEVKEQFVFHAFSTGVSIKTKRGI